jgi:bacteriocin biosynthesis cyclodehydratase domain-containing protein
MASAIRMTPAASGKVALAGAGPFGMRVASLLAAAHPGYREASATLAEISAAFTEPTTAVVIALWRPEPDLCDAADSMSYRYQRPWLPVVMEHPVIRIGPLVRPPAGPCFRCYARRRRQHDRQPWVTAALQAAYDKDQACGPGGFLPHHARLAAAVARDMLRRLQACSPGRTGPELGDVTTIRLSDMGLNIGLRSSRVIACHDCDRCGEAGLPGAPDWLTDLALSLGVSRADRGPMKDPDEDLVHPDWNGAVR